MLIQPLGVSGGRGGWGAVGYQESLQWRLVTSDCEAIGKSFLLPEPQRPPFKIMGGMKDVPKFAGEWPIHLPARIRGG